MSETLQKPIIANPRKQSFKVADLLAKTAGDIAMVTVQHVSFRSARYYYDRLGRITLECVTVTRIPGENQRLHKMQWYARDQNYSGKLSQCPSIMASCDCVTGDTRVLTDKGMKTIYSLIDRSSNSAIEFPINYIVNGKIHKGSVPYHKGKKPVWEITLENGSKLKATKEHKIRVLREIIRPRNYIGTGPVILSGADNRNAYIWNLKFADGKKLKVTDMVSWCKQNNHNYKSFVRAINLGKQYKNIVEVTKTRPIRIKVAPKKQVFTSERKRSFRWVRVKDLKTGDLIALNTSKFIDIVKRDPSYWKSYFMGVFHGDGTLNPLSIECHAHKKIIDLIKNSGVSLQESEQKGRYLIPIEGIEILHPIIMKNRHYIPDDINIFGFVSGLIDTDGSVSSDNRVSIYGSIELEVIADKLKSLGIKGIKFNLNRKKGTKTNLGISTKDMYVLHISVGGLKQIQKNLCSVKLDHLKELKEINVHENVSKVKSIVFKGNSHVYDISVPGIQRFVAESMIVHNCKRWLYFCEYAWWSKGLAEIRYCNGEFPVTTNPGRKIFCCKHLLRSGLVMVSKRL